MGLYLDDDSRHNKLVEHLEDHGLDVVVPEDFDLGGHPDLVHFQKSMEEGRRLVTNNRQDFEILLERVPDHPGIYVWNRENIVRKDLNWRGVGQILVEFEASEELEAHWPNPPIIDLSQYRYLLDE